MYVRLSDQLIAIFLFQSPTCGEISPPPQLEVAGGCDTVSRNDEAVVSNQVERFK
jgi:hypothetical protein